MTRAVLEDDRTTATSIALTHASWFSGAGGIDLGLERAGWRTVSFCEIDPYACALLAERWPNVPNLGDVRAVREPPIATLWSGGFPCQDVSIAGQRAGLQGQRSGLVWPWLDLVARGRPRLLLIENVPGLISSHGGRDMAALLGALVELGYGVAYRILNAQFFGVPQHRRRVFIVGVRGEDDDPTRHLAAECAGAILGVGTRCGKHSAMGREELDASEFGSLDGVSGSLTTSDRRPFSIKIIRSPLDSDRARASDGMAGRMDDRALLAPKRLDSYRERLTGNGVVAPVAEWIGRRLRRFLEGTL